MEKPQRLHLLSHKVAPKLVDILNGFGICWSDERARLPLLVTESASRLTFV